MSILYIFADIQKYLTTFIRFVELPTNIKSYHSILYIILFFILFYKHKLAFAQDNMVHLTNTLSNTLEFTLSINRHYIDKIYKLNN